MIKAIFQNSITTIIGLVLIGAGVYSGVTAKSSWTEASAIITIGLGLIAAKDAHK